MWLSQIICAFTEEQEFDYSDKINKGDFFSLEIPST